MKKIKILLLSLILASLSLPTFGAASENAKKHDRKISVQAYTFRNNTLEEVLKILSELGVKYVECYPEQKLSDKYPNARVDWNLNAEQRAFLKKLMKDTGVQMKSYGCIMKSPRPVAELEAQVKNVCEFAADMGVEQVQTEAKFCEIPMWLKYAKKHGLTIGVHHHAIDAYNNQYYRPEALTDLVDRFKVQALCDTGHWARSGLDPLKCLKYMRGKFKFGIHFKDLNTFGEVQNFKGVAYGTGVLNAKAMLQELDNQGFDGYFIIENEQIYEDPVPVVKACVEWLRNN